MRANFLTAGITAYLLSLVSLSDRACATDSDASTSPLSPRAGSSIEPKSFQPKLGGLNFPDPSIIQVNKIWYSFATRTKGSSIHVQIAQSPDFESWSLIMNENGTQRDALPHLPPWIVASSPNVWAPDVSVLDDGTFVMYYSASVNADSTKHCIGVATSKDVLGPYTSQGNFPMICPLKKGGAIDPAGFSDGARRYIVYKIDGNSLGSGGPCGNTVPATFPTSLVLQPLAPNGISLTGSPKILLDHSKPTDDGILEAPSLVKAGSTYVLFFSSGCFTSGHYTVSYAVSSALTGPYIRSAQPLLQTGDYGLTAPGGASIYKDGKHLVFHANWSGHRALFAMTVAIVDSETTVDSR